MLSIFFIGLALSMDAFSIALGIGIMKLKKSQKLSMSLLVGIMHFLMPLFGFYISDKLSFLFKLNFDILIIFIFMYAGLIIIFEKKAEERTLNYNFINIFLLAFSVSVDSFTIGLGLKSYNDSCLIASIIFFVCSFIITYFGLMIGEYSTKHLKEKAPILGGMIFLFLAIVNIIEILLK